MLRLNSSNKKYLGHYLMGKGIESKLETDMPDKIVGNIYQYNIRCETMTPILKLGIWDPKLIFKLNITGSKFQANFNFSTENDINKIQEIYSKNINEESYFVLYIY